MAGPRSRSGARRRLIWLAVAAGLVLVGWAIFQAVTPSPVRHHAPEPPYAAARAKLLAEPNVRDVVRVGSQDLWNVAVAPGGGDPMRFAKYLCAILVDNDVVSPSSRVRIVDAARLEAGGYDYARAQLAVTGCAGPA